MFAQAHMGRKRFFPMLSLHPPGCLLLAAARSTVHQEHLKGLRGTETPVRLSGAAFPHESHL
jgi:hypothetical protein